MTIELGLLLAIAAGIIGLATFYIGRQSAAKKDGQEWGEIKTDIKYIKNDVSEIKASFGENIKSAMAAIAKEEAERKESLRRLHERIDDHITTHHSQGSKSE